MKKKIEIKLTDRVFKEVEKIDKEYAYLNYELSPKS